MNDELKKDLQVVLGHQLEGIMFHADVMNLYELMGFNAMRKIHRAQMFEELNMHMCTMSMLIEEYGIIIEPVSKRVPIKMDAPVGYAERMVVSSELISKWLAWEVDTEKLYESIASKMPTCKHWKKLIHAVEHEINKIQKKVG